MQYLLQKKFTEISEDDIKIIKHTFHSVLTYNGKLWIKKDQESTFDVPYEIILWRRIVRSNWFIFIGQLKQRIRNGLNRSV